MGFSLDTIGRRLIVDDSLLETFAGIEIHILNI
jgi:hypothetical protein